MANDWVDARFMSDFFLFFHNMDMHARPDTHGFTIPYSTNNPDFYHFTKDIDPWPTFNRDGGNTPDGEAFLSAVSRGEIESCMPAFEGFMPVRSTSGDVPDRRQTTGPTPPTAGK